MGLTKNDFLFGAIAFGLMIFVVVSNISTNMLTGFVVGDPQDITLLSTIDNTQTDYYSNTFIFKYPYDIAMEECSLVLNGGVVKITNAIISPQDTRIRVDLSDGKYDWEIECLDSDGGKHLSGSRTLYIGDIVDEKPLNYAKKEGVVKIPRINIKNVMNMSLR